MDVHRSDDCIFFQTTLSSGRSIEVKQRYYKALTDGLHECIKLRERMSLLVWLKCQKRTGRMAMLMRSTPNSFTEQSQQSHGIR